MPRSCGSRQIIIVSFRNLSKKRRMVPVQSETKENIHQNECTFGFKAEMSDSKHLRNAIWAPMSGGKFFCTVDTTQMASDLAPSSRLLLRIFLKNIWLIRLEWKWNSQSSTSKHLKFFGDLFYHNRIIAITEYKIKIIRMWRLLKTDLSLWCRFQFFVFIAQTSCDVCCCQKSSS